MPRRWRIPCTTSKAISSSKLTPWSTALLAATTGQMTTSPNRTSWSKSGSTEPGPVPPSSGEPPPPFDIVLDGEGQDVGGVRLAQEAFVERGDGGRVDKQQRHLGVVLYPLGLQNSPGQVGPALDGHRMVGLLVGGVDFNAHRYRRRCCRPPPWSPQPRR